MNNNLSILKIVNGLSKTLNIANQMIPLYKQVKPLISKSNQLFSNITTTKKTTNTNNTKVQQSTIKETNYQTSPITQNNLPTFFQ